MIDHRRAASNTSLRKANAELSAEKYDFSSKLAELKSKNEELEENYDELVKSNAESIGEMDATKDKLAKERAENSSLKGELETARRKQVEPDAGAKEVATNIGEQATIITSYEVVLADIRRSLKHYNWKYVVIDEKFKLLPMENKLLLTGTPLQNNLAELWSLLNFILPDIFSSHEEFESCKIAKLHAILRPFILRRIKADVEQMLPRKNEIILYATMTEYQKNFQDHLINKTLGSYLINTKAETGHFSVICAKLNAYNLMIQLRKNCNHPDLLESVFDDSYMYPPIEQIVEQCGKFCMLDRLLTKLFALGHKVLIFSQWVNVLDIMDYYFSEKGFEVCIIDGNVKLEVRRIQSRFGIFLLSTRASGLGINLTAADTCILYDSDWNPQMDLKAMDRCHRIGQTKPVHVYSFATAQSGRILKIAFSKLKLEHEDILALLRDEETTEDKMIQTDITDEDLNKVLDHSDMFNRKAEDDETNGVAVAFPMKGPGWEVVIPTTTGGMLSSLNN
ncbi:hypothetical protein UlMin_012445 [Ulmus minor]